MDTVVVRDVRDPTLKPLSDELVEHGPGPADFALQN
jgi:hypothetical protein